MRMLGSKDWKIQQRFPVENNFMKESWMKTLVLTLSFLIVYSCSVTAQSMQSSKKEPNREQSESVLVPLRNNTRITPDGMFSPGEWDGALAVPMSENCILCLLADSENLYLGLKSSKPAATMLSEVYFANDEKQYCNLHSSDRLGEGASPFRESPTFKVGVTKEWSANVNSFNLARLEEWQAAGKPLDTKRYGDIYGKNDGREYRISRKKFSGVHLKLKVGFIYLKEGEKESVEYPGNSSFNSANDWIDLILPSAVEAAIGGDVSIWYLGHCGFAVRTSKYLLIFDYQELRDGQQPKSRPSKPSLANGWIHPEEIKDLSVRVFASHSHDDHYDPVILEWKKTVPDIQYFFGWKAADDTSFHYLVGPRAEYNSGGLEIATINSHHSGVPEVAWLVKVDGLVIYHNGDCQPDDPVAEYEFLKTKAEPIDIAFVPPVHEERWKYSAQNLLLFREFSPRLVFPMHAKAGDTIYVDFEKAWKSKIPDLPISLPRKMGERFDYEQGKIRK